MSTVPLPSMTAWLAVAVLAGCTAGEPGPDAGTAAGSTAPPPSGTASVAPADWIPHTSDEYGLEVGHPPDWTAVPASRSWEFADAAERLSPAHDTFRSPDEAVLVSIWQVPLDPRTGIGSTGDIASWVEEYCDLAGEAPCTGIDDRAVELCLEKWDCHPGLLVPFESGVQAFFSGGIYDAGAMTVVAVRPGGSPPDAAPYGGAQRLLEAFLSTMAVWPASIPRDERLCYGRPPVGLGCGRDG